MPRPKPIEPLVKNMQVRLNARHALIYKQLGGVKWMRAMLDKHTPMPKKYYEKNSEG
jgi:hypothetical protein